MARGIKRLIAIARENVSDQIRKDRASAMGAIGKADAGSGYNGGYRAALDDVLLALNGVKPNRNWWWEKEE